MPEARPFATLREDDAVVWRHRVSDDDVDSFAGLSGDVNPLHLDDRFAQQHGFRGRVAHGMLLGAFISRVLGTALPGPGVLWLSQTFRFQRAVYVGEEVEVEVRITHLSPELRTLVLDTTVRKADGDEAIRGEARVMMLPVVQTVPWDEMVAVVTGGSRGIGAAISRGLAERGVRVVVNYRERSTDAEALVQELGASFGVDAHAVAADVSTVDGAKTLAAAALERFGRVDVLVNNATPFIARTALLDTSWETLDGFWRTYVQSAFVLAQELVPGMRERGFGRIVHMLSTAMWGAPPPETGAYVAAKSGLWGLAKAMAVEFAPYGITVNAVSPSAVMTEQWDEVSDNRRRALSLRIPAQRLATPDEVAAAVLHLVGNDAGYLTGANFPVAGGEVM